MFKNKTNIKLINYKHFPSSTRDWKNSIYHFNKNGINLIPVARESALNLIKSYFNLYNFDLEKKIRKKRLLLRLKRLSSNKIFISNGEFKHTNNKVIITLYLYNRQKYNYKIKIKKQFFNKVFRLFKIKLYKKINLIKYNGFIILCKIYKNKNLFSPLNRKFNKHTLNFIIKSYKMLIKNCLKKLNRYMYYKQLFYINKSKLNFIYLQFLKKHLERLYNKNVEFNLVNIKRFYLNSDIMTESIAIKLTKNRRKLLNFLNKLKNKIKIRRFSLLHRPEASNILKVNFLNNKKLLKNLKYKHVSGFRLEARGRLTKRYTASRSLSKLMYKGTLMNIDSSYKGLSSVLLKGNLRSNLQATKLKSKTRIGSFGLKGWVSGN